MMGNIFVRSVTMITCMLIITSVHADNFCDEAFVSNSLISLESDDDFNLCKLQKIKVRNHDTSLEILDLLTSLKKSYFESVDDDIGVNGNIDLDAPMTKIMMVSGINIDGEGGLNDLSKWAVDVHSYLKTPKKKIMKLNFATTSNEIEQQRCEVKFRWRKLQALRNKILKCVVKMKAIRSESTTEDIGDGD